MTKGNFIFIKFIACTLLAISLTITEPSAASCRNISGSEKPVLPYSITCHYDHCAGLQPSGLVLQVIGNNLYKWHEYYDHDKKTVSIYLLEPFEAPLDKTGATFLLGASSHGHDLTSHNDQREQNSFLLSDSESFIKSPAKLTGIYRENTLTSGYQQENINDDRYIMVKTETTAYPYCNIGFLNVIFNNSFMRSTGFLIAPNLALTNAHNIYSSALGGWFDQLHFSPGQYEKDSLEVERPFSTLNPVAVDVNEFFFHYEGDNEMSMRHDLAALFFAEPFIEIDTFIPIEFNYIPDEVIVAGYPGLVRDKSTLGMWASRGRVTDSSEYFLYYDAYTSGGNSGSPVITYNTQTGTYRLVAIHAFASPGYFSGGPHFNELNRADIEKWLKQSIAYLDSEPGDEEVELPDYDPGQEENSDDDLPDYAAVMGDINGNGEVNVKDVTILLQYLLNLAELDGEARLRADVNADGLINVIDATLIMQYVLGIIDSF